MYTFPGNEKKIKYKNKYIYIGHEIWYLPFPWVDIIVTSSDTYFRLNTFIQNTETE